MIETSAVLSALPHACAILDASGRATLRNPAFDALIPDATLRVDGLAVNDSLAVYDGIDRVMEMIGQSVGAGPWKQTFRLTRTVDPLEPPQRFDFHVQAFDFEDTRYLLALAEEIQPEDAQRRQLHGLQERLSEIRHIKHEISNSLMGLMGNAELLSDQANFDANARTKLERVLASARKIRDQLENIADVILGQLRS